MKHSIQQIGTGGQKATLIMPLKSSRNPLIRYCCTISLGVNRSLWKTQSH